MTQIRAIDITNDFLTSQGGLRIGKKVEGMFRADPSENIEISFEGVYNVAPSFVNGAFLYLIDNYGEDYFRHRIKVVHSTNEVAKIISESVRTYIEHQHIFYSKLRTNKIFVAGDQSDLDKNVFESLTKLYGDSGFKPYFNPTPGLFSEATKVLIHNSDAVIGILNKQEQSAVFLKQLEYSASLSKPCIILQRRSLNTRVSSTLADKIQIMYFDDQDFIDQLNKLNLLLVRYRRDIIHVNSKPPTISNFNTDTALVAVLAIALLVAMFFALSEKEKNERRL